MARLIALVLTLLTGVSGLVYEVAWQRWLATLLGSHSEATAAVASLCEPSSVASQRCHATS